jgi:hypothetical protein
MMKGSAEEKQSAGRIKPGRKNATIAAVIAALPGYDWADQKNMGRKEGKQTTWKSVIVPSSSGQV